MDVYRQGPDYSGQRSNPLRRVGQLFFGLLLLGGLTAGLFLLFFRGYVVEGPDGLRLHPPLLKAGSQTAQVSGTVSGISVSEDQPVAELAPSPEPLQAVYLPLEAMADGSYEKTLGQNGCHAVIFDMKDGHGNLGYVSDQPLAIASGASAADPERNDAIHAMNREESLYTIARIACFRDDTLIAQRPDLSLLRVSGSPWRDKNGDAWLAPASGDVQRYLLDLCREAAALGFDEVLLTQCHYPADGNFKERSDAYEDSATSEAVLEDFYSEARALLEAEGVRLSILWEEAPSDNQGHPLSGQTIQGAMLSAHRVWVWEPEMRAAEAFSVGPRAQEDSSVVTIRSDAGDSGTSWAICPKSF